jgi:hypothetical protein
MMTAEDIQRLEREAEMLRLQEMDVSSPHQGKPYEILLIVLEELKRLLGKE